MTTKAYKIIIIKIKFETTSIFPRITFDTIYSEVLLF